MRRKTRENGAPAWGLTELAVGMGKKLARQCHADEKLVIASLYLAHIVFHTDRKSHRMKDHPKLSAKLARGYLKKWGVLKTEQDVIINAIAIHHSVLSPKSKVAEVMRNAEGYKFLTIEGCLIFLHDLGTRGMSWEKSVEYFLEKMNQKYALLTLPACKREMRKNISLLTQMLDRAT
ncbi:MAG: hypothetical protein A2898_05570 [Candidatus Kerfeldbacteria bacterium RIFCSPLOWO2_01_FULL_48_11]|uniref:HD domain-containing protein n=1 Tax=Candidatus Kerfeldbacteria bacterium RIFCSPLOWO2_01_FULL_48_11 TaxID=1798543 RepID=A0A1G2AZW6_9BACT|nr:MAG: hypothetical protein A2898_05570 [Candidatus Kerfeldbacteria bacterium RIFCSPLOWO2_01_FULL_48_11]HCJ52272.1 hypothetical protein [Candidatus Kerfeldbacteria bacterium]